MITLWLALIAVAAGFGGLLLLFLKWKGRLRHRFAVAGGWSAIILSIGLWSAAYHPIVAIPFAVLALTLLALGLVVYRADIRTLMRFPASERNAGLETGPPASWSGITARTLSSVLIAPVFGLAAALLMWLWMPGHPATRFCWAVFGFATFYAVIQVWGLSAERPWRAVGLQLVAGVVVALPVVLSLGGQ